jgi:hypothetical protein
MFAVDETTNDAVFTSSSWLQGCNSHFIAAAERRRDGVAIDMCCH